MLLRRLLFLVTIFIYGITQNFSLAAEEAMVYHREIDHSYATINNQHFYMDIFTPAGTAPTYYQPGTQGKGFGIIQIVSGSWRSDRSRFNPHENAHVYNLLCARGYTVFAVRPGSRPDYSLLEMLDHIRVAIRYIKSHAEQWDIDSEKLGIFGASAGGHLAALTALEPQAAITGSQDSILQYDTSVAAVALFFPPTDFLDWDGQNFLDFAPDYWDLFFSEAKSPKVIASIRKRVASLSPVHLVRGNHPPFFIVHGDADLIVPVTQSRKLVQALRQLNTDVNYQEIKGVGHNWITLPVQILDMVNWFDEQLSGELQNK